MISQEPEGLRPSSVLKRRAILAAAEESFLSGGYDGVTMDEIATASGVSKQTVYAHFGTKDRLFVELVTAMAQGAADEVAAGRGAPPSREEVETWLVDLLDHQLALVIAPRLTRLRRLVISEVPRHPELARAVHEQGPARAVERLEEVLRELDGRGWLRVPDPGVAAVQLNWLVMGAPTSDAMYLGEAAAPDPDSRRDHVRSAVATFARSYAAP